MLQIMSELKQVILVRSDLHLPKGKLAAQVGHACIDAAFASPKQVVKKWREQGMMKIVLKLPEDDPRNPGVIADCTGDNAGDSVGLLSEYLTDQALAFSGHPGSQAKSNSTFFASLLYLPTPTYPLAVEYLKPNGMPLDPWMLNFKLGHFLKLNFDLAFLKFNGGWDVLGTFQFRYTQFPKKG